MIDGVPTTVVGEGGHTFFEGTSDFCLACRLEFSEFFDEEVQAVQICKEYDYKNDAEFQQGYYDGLMLDPMVSADPVYRWGHLKGTCKRVFLDHGITLRR